MKINDQKVALIGATGFIGRAVLKELLDRGHEVIAIVRHPENAPIQNEKLTWRKADMLHENEVSDAVKGAVAVISAYNAGWTNPGLYKDFLTGSEAIQAGVKKAGIKRLIVIGGAGSLYVADGVQLVDTPEFPETWRAGAKAARDYLNILKKEAALDWTFFSPAIEMNPATSGKRTGNYRTGLDTPVFDSHHHSVLSVEDVAVAIVDELENPKHVRQRFTAAW